jgi:hypothetical protein
MSTDKVARHRGSKRNYNITINQTGDGLETEYAVQPSPHTKTPADILKLYKEKNINLEALFGDGNAFEASERSEEIDAEDFKRDFLKKPAADENEVNSDDVPF